MQRIGRFVSKEGFERKRKTPRRAFFEGTKTKFVELLECVRNCGSAACGNRGSIDNGVDETGNVRSTNLNVGTFYECGVSGSGLEGSGNLEHRAEAVSVLKGNGRSAESITIVKELGSVNLEGNGVNFASYVLYVGVSNEIASAVDSTGSKSCTRGCRDIVSDTLSSDSRFVNHCGSDGAEVRNGLGFLSVLGVALEGEEADGSEDREDRNNYDEFNEGKTLSSLHCLYGHMKKKKK